MVERFYRRFHRYTPDHGCRRLRLRKVERIARKIDTYLRRARHPLCKSPTWKLIFRDPLQRSFDGNRLLIFYCHFQRYPGANERYRGYFERVRTANVLLLPLCYLFPTTISTKKRRSFVHGSVHRGREIRVFRCPWPDCFRRSSYPHLSNRTSSPRS